MTADAEAEIPYLMVNLGVAYLRGEYCFGRDLKLARFWLEKAAAKGDVDAKESLRHLAAAERQGQQSSGASAKSRAQQDFIALIESVGPDRSDPHKFSYEVALYCQFGGKQCNVLRGMSEKFYDASNTRALQENMQRIRNQYRTTPAESQKFDARTKCLQQRSESIRRATYGQQDWYYDTKC